MKKIWVLVLLISLGLNLGFGLRMLNDRSRSGEGGHFRRSEQSHGFHGRWADRDSVARGKMFARRLEHIADSMDLSPEQRDEFAKVHAQTGRMLMRRRGLISEKRDRLHTLMTSDEIDQDGIRQAIAELGQEQAVLDSLVAETMLQEMAVLAPEQRVLYLELLSFEKGGRGRMQGRGGRGSGHQ
jgi:Spy/CpxP family protein refolding chaperone